MGIVTGKAFPAFLDLVLVMAAYSTSLGLRLRDPLVGDPRLFWADFFLSLPVIVGIHLIANFLAGAFGYSGKQVIGAVVLANVLSAALLLVLGFVVRSELSVLLPYSVILVGAGLSLAAMLFARFLSRSRQWIGPR